MVSPSSADWNTLPCSLEVSVISAFWTVMTLLRKIVGTTVPLTSKSEMKMLFPVKIKSGWSEMNSYFAYLYRTHMIFPCFVRPSFENKNLQKLKNVRNKPTVVLRTCIIRILEINEFQVSIFALVKRVEIVSYNFGIVQ